MFDLRREDENPITRNREEVRCFMAVKNEIVRLPDVLRHHRTLGVSRFFIVDNASDDGTREYLLEQSDCHYFFTAATFDQGRFQTNWLNALLNTFGAGHWCLLIDADELLVYPEMESISVGEFCSSLDDEGADSVFATVLDMYGKGPIAEYSYRQGQSLLGAFPYFDPQPLQVRFHAPFFPPFKLVGSMRQRVFFGKERRAIRLPALSVLPLVKWTQERRFLYCRHAMVPEGKLSRAQCAILHFKFALGVGGRLQSEGRIQTANPEWAAYPAALEENPDLRLDFPGSARYEDSRQLVKFGLMQTA